MNRIGWGARLERMIQLPSASAASGVRRGPQGGLLQDSPPSVQGFSAVEA